MSENLVNTNTDNLKVPDKTIQMPSRKFVRTLIQLGLAGILTACSAMESAAAEIPQVSLEDIVADPALYTNLPLIRTSGYPEDVTTKTVNVPVITAKDGGGWDYKWISKTTDTYELQTTADDDAPYIELLVDAGTYGGGSAAGPVIEATTNQLQEDVLYDITGQIIAVKSPDGGQTYVFAPSAIEPANQ